MPISNQPIKGVIIATFHFQLRFMGYFTLLKLIAVGITDGNWQVFIYFVTIL